MFKKDIQDLRVWNDDMSSLNLTAMKFAKYIHVPLKDEGEQKQKGQGNPI